MNRISTIGLDLAKTIFQVHAVDASGAVVLQRALRRGRVLEFFASLPPCLIGMEACATAHYWARELSRLGHKVRLIPPAYAKAYVRRNKNDAAEAAAICEAVSRPNMRFVVVKTEGQQAAAGVHKTRELLVKQRTMIINHLRGMMAEFGIVAAAGPQHAAELVAVLLDPAEAHLPVPLRQTLRVMVDLFAAIERKLEGIDKQLLDWGRNNQTCRNLVTIPGYGPILSSAMAAIVVDPKVFRSGREFAASLGLVPRHEGTSGHIKLGPISKRGNGYLRRLLVNGPPRC